MARKQKKYHYLYKTTNLINGKFYIGMHSTDNLEDGYLGSGKRLRHSLNKYGKENFKFEILEFFKTRTILKNKEKDLVNEEILKDPLCMNMVVGGGGGFISVEVQKKRSFSANKKLNYLLSNDENFRKDWLEKVSLGLKKAYKDGKHIGWKYSYDWVGKHHSEETKKKMSDTKKGMYDGELHPQYGSCWITKNGVNKKIKKEEIDFFINDGWVRGRKV
jgi:group I intron endonuclease